MLAEQSDGWTANRRYMGLDLLARARVRIVTAGSAPTGGEPVMATEAMTA